MADQVKIQVNIYEDVLGNEFHDAIYYGSMQAYQDALANGTHQAEKDRRFQNQVNAIQNPTPIKEVSKEELLQAKQSLLDQVASLDAQIAVAKPANQIDVIKDI